ncbi:MAG: hypothetical protein ACM357_09860 [Gemmatimonadota bacterium]
MIRAYLVAGALVLLPACVPEPKSERTDRSGAACDPPAVWPALPTVEAIAARATYDSSPLAASARTMPPPADPDVAVPQYAFLRDADRTSCEPVIVVEAGREHVVYWGVDLTSNGIAPRNRVELLGTDRSAASR